MEWYCVWWPWVTSNHVAWVCQHRLSFLSITAVCCTYYYTLSSNRQCALDFVRLFACMLIIVRICYCVDTQYLYVYTGSSAERVHIFTIIPTVVAALLAILYSCLHWMSLWNDHVSICNQSPVLYYVHIDTFLVMYHVYNVFFMYVRCCCYFGCHIMILVFAMDVVVKSS